MTTEYPPTVIAILPRPRKSRHPWQWCICTALVLLAVSQLTVGPLSVSSLAGESELMTLWLNAQTLVACVLCLAATWVQDGWMRLGVEFAGQALAASVLGFYAVITFNKYGFAQGLGLGGTLAAAIAVAAVIRSGQIACTAKRFRRAVLLSAEQAQDGP